MIESSEYINYKESFNIKIYTCGASSRVDNKIENYRNNNRASNNLFYNYSKIILSFWLRNFSKILIY